MRAPVQMKRPRRTGGQPASEGGAAERTPVGTGRPTHVRNRLILAVAVVAAAVAGAGAPSLIAASGQLSDAQELVNLAGRTESALTLAHALADERDEVTSFVAAGRPKSKTPSEDRGARVDQQVEELRADTDTPAGLRSELDTIASVRKAALTGKGTALDAHEGYTAVITDLHRLAEELAEQMPPRAGSGAYALAELDTAVQQSAATRGLLLAALKVPSTTQTVIDPLTGLPTTAAVTSDADKKQRDALTAAAQQARLRADAALADFREGAPGTAVATYDSTVTGPEADAADKDLAGLTDQPTLSDGELATSTKKLDAALSARGDLMRGAESSLYHHRTKDLSRLRDDDVTELEIRTAALGALLLVAIGVATALARTLTRPLSVLRRGSARLAEAEDLTAEGPIAFTGRNDEFARAVRSVNTLHARAVALHERVATLETDRKHLVGQRQKMADARQELRDALQVSQAQLEQLRAGIGGTFVNLALRTLGLVERQLAVIEGLEEREQDPDRLATIFKLDHFTTVMRRHSENLLVLAGSERVLNHPGPVPLVDVVRAAVSEIERYERVRIAALPPHAHVVGFAADDISHLLAELMENATSFSPPEQPVEISGWLLENGEVMLSVQDEGIGMTGDRLERLNARLADFDPNTSYGQDGEDGLGLGLYVVARLAQRHGVRVQLREQKQGGVTAVVVLSQDLLESAAATSVPSAAATAGGAPTVSLPGADAEVNSNVLHGRAPDDDPLVALAERAVSRAAATDAPADPAQARPEPGDGPATPEHPVAADPESPVAGTAEHSAAPEHPAAGPVEHSAATEAGTAPVEHAAVPEPAVSSETFAETTMELLVPNPAAVDAATARPGTPAPVPAPAPDPSDEAHGYPAPAPGPARTTEAPETVRSVDAPEAPRPTEESGAPRSADGAHGRPPTPGADAGVRASAVGGTGDEAAHERTPDLLTAKGLPKRTPKVTAPAQAPRRTAGSVDADALRRRLGGFHRGAEAGRREVEAEMAGETPGTSTPADRPAERTAGETTGGTVEEASS